MAIGADRRREILVDGALQPALLEHRAGGGVEADQDAAVVHHEQHALVEQRGGHLRHGTLVAPFDGGRRHVALAAQRHREQPVLRAEHRAEHLPLARVELLVAIEVEGREPVIAAEHLVHRLIADNLGLADQPVAVLVVALQPFVKRHRRHLPSRLVLRKAPAVHVQRLAVETRHGLHLARQPAHPPQLLPVGDGIRRQLERLRNHNLRRTAGGVVDRRRRVAGDDVRAIHLPALLARAAIDRQQVGSQVLIDRQHQQVVHQHGRRAKAVVDVERPQRQPPAFLAVGREADEAELLEERVHRLAVGHRAWRGRAVDVLDAPRLCSRHFTPPQLFARRPVERDDEQLVVGLVGGVRRQEDARLGEHRRRMPRRQRRFPHDVARWPDVGRQVRGFRDASAIGPAEARPVGRGGDGKDRDQREE